MDRNEKMMVPAWHLWNMAAALMGATPDLNTQTPEEVERTEEVIHALATVYFPPTLDEDKERARDVLRKHSET